jgi:hypothetical protein
MISSPSGGVYITFPVTRLPITVPGRFLIVGAVGRVGGDDATPDTRAEEVGGEASAGGPVRRRLLEVCGRLGKPDE